MHLFFHIKKICTVLICAAMLFAQDVEMSFIEKGDDAFEKFDNQKALENYNDAVKNKS